MNRSGPVMDTTASPIDQQTPEMPGLISDSGGVVFLLCVSDKHKLGEIHPGNILKIKDRRCKTEVVFELTPLLRKEEGQAK